MSASEPMPESDLARFGLSSDAIRQLDAGLDWVALFRQGQLDEAYARLRRENPLPEMTSHIRPDPTAADNVTLRQLQYLVAWTARERGLTGVQLPPAPSGRQIAVVGGGPAGLAGTVRLLERGHAVDLFERTEKLGGAPALVYAANRLPEPQDEIDALFQPAVAAARLAIHLTANVAAKPLRENHDAVLLATGRWNERSLGQADGVWPALRFLKAARDGRCPAVPRSVTILCGGDAAMDAAVVAQQLGAERLHLLFDVPREQAHWHLPASWFDTAGVEARFDVRPLGYQVTDHGAVRGVKLADAGPLLETEMVIEAMSLAGDELGPPAPDVFPVGALVNGGASVQQCLREGFAAADAIERHLRERRSSS